MLWFKRYSSMNMVIFDVMLCSQRWICSSRFSRHGFFLQDWIVNLMLNLVKRTMTYPGFEPGTFGLAVSIANHYTI
jgi:hypothetical protein